MCEPVPDRLSLAVLVPPALDLISRGRCAPKKILREGSLGRVVKPQRMQRRLDRGCGPSRGRGYSAAGEDARRERSQCCQKRFCKVTPCQRQGRTQFEARYVSILIVFNERSSLLAGERVV